MAHACRTLVDSLLVHLAFHPSSVVDMEVSCVLGIRIYYYYRLIAPTFSLVCQRISTVATVRTQVGGA